MVSQCYARVRVSVFPASFWYSRVLYGDSVFMRDANFEFELCAAVMTSLGGG